MVPRSAPPPADMPTPTIQAPDELPDTPKSEVSQTRPSNPRRTTEPTSGTPSQTSEMSTLSLRTRNRSPFSRSHQRSRSSASALSAPLMTRAHSSPVVDTAGRVLMSTNTMRPSSPLGPPGRRTSPLRRPFDDTYPSFGGQLDIWETISENQELELTPRATTIDTDPMLSSPISLHHTNSRNRRRPSPPLYQIGQPTMSNSSVTSTSASSSSSPSLAPTKFNEPYPSNSSFTSSSMPSTPTSLRSRSPSISSLETIPDSPDAEEAALEAENIARLKAAADDEAEGRDDSICVGDAQQRRSSLDVPGGRSMVLGANSFGVVFGARDKRKRWSVCGAERRGDLDLETIWED
ncbi:MAG: hypothetical protein M1830_008067 [Pleopsidium flavum]|nr:MAG: hypothetical protein M1830_008067 [Pleopsidium flavum]